MIAANDIYKTPANVWARLAAPLTGTGIFWRQDSKPIARDGRFFARFVAYVEADTVRERLDSVVPGEWDLTLTPLRSPVGDDPNGSVCSLKARLQVLGVVREDVGMGRDYKQAATDAFKRAAMRFGIGHELYAYGANWVELDGEGRSAKPVEDPAVVYARSTGGTTLRVAEENPGVTAHPDSTAQPRRALALDEETCPKCGGRMWDNRLTKRNPRAPDFKCRNRSCDGVIWPAKPGDPKAGAVAKAEPKKSGEPAADWPPLNSAPLVRDTELPF